MPCPEKDQTIYIHENQSEDGENVQLSGPVVRCQRRSRDRCKPHSKDCLVNMEGNYWGDVRQEHTNKVERQCVQDGYKNWPWCMEQNVGQLERKRGNSTQLKGACCVGQDERRD